MEQFGRKMSEKHVDKANCRKVGRRLTKSMLVRMGIPRRFWTAEYGEIHEGSRQRLDPFLKGIKRALSAGYGMVLWGNNGVGKTATASVCMKEARRVGKTAYFITMSRLIEDSIRRTMYNESLLVIDRCRQVDLLVVDDVGKENVDFTKEKDTTEAMFEDLIRERNSNRRSSIVTTNLSPDNVIKRYGASFGRMLQESTPFIEIEGESKRLETRKEVEAFFAFPGERCESK